MKKIIFLFTALSIFSCTKKESECTELRNRREIACTKEYAPVCGILLLYFLLVKFNAFYENKYYIIQKT